MLFDIVNREAINAFSGRACRLGRDAPVGLGVKWGRIRGVFVGVNFEMTINDEFFAVI